MGPELDHPDAYYTYLCGDCRVTFTFTIAEASNHHAEHTR